MGNAALCAPSLTSNGAVKIVTSDGRLLIYTRQAVKAAEIMLENPGHFLCESTHLKIGQRIPGICAEEELERGQVYFLLPMEMLYSVLTDDEMKFLTQTASRGIKQAAITLKISRIFPEFCLFPNGNSGVAGSTDEICAGESQQRYSRQRSWQPALETIVETPPHT